jgi:hypothetical protein
MKTPALIALLALASPAARADQLVITGSSKEGAFQRFEDGKFEFMPAKGRLIKQAGVNRFSQAKRAFDAFVSENAAMVKEMDLSKGARRLALLDRLRERKLAEQPLRNELVAAYTSLTELFPDPAESPRGAANRKR